MSTLRFVESRFLSLYVNELWMLALSAIAKCDELFVLCQPPKEGYLLWTLPEIQWHVSSILSDAANLSKLLAIPESRYRETEEEFRFRIERASALMESLGVPDYPELMKRAARNSIEHFDQHLDRASVAYETAKSSGKPTLYGMAISSRSAFSEDLFKLRVYVADERKFYNFDFEADLGKLHSECSDLVTRIQKLNPKSDGPAGLLLIGDRRA